MDLSILGSGSGTSFVASVAWKGFKEDFVTDTRQESVSGLIARVGLIQSQDSTKDSMIPWSCAEELVHYVRYTQHPSGRQDRESLSH